MNWNPDDILDHCIAALRDHSRQLDDQQQPKGLDALSELAIQSVLAESLAARGLAVLREQHFPSLRRPGASFTQRERCDLVLESPGPAAPPDPAERYWLEVKVTAQFAYRRGVPGPNRQYTSQLIRSLCEDLQKLDDDPLIRAGGILVVLFTSDESIAEHDLGIALQRCIDKQIKPGRPVHDSFRLADRIGNAVCSLWLTPIRRS